MVIIVRVYMISIRVNDILIFSTESQHQHYEILCSRGPNNPNHVIYIIFLIYIG